MNPRLADLYRKGRGRVEKMPLKRGVKDLVLALLYLSFVQHKKDYGAFPSRRTLCDILAKQYGHRSRTRPVNPGEPINGSLLALSTLDDWKREAEQLGLIVREYLFKPRKDGQGNRQTTNIYRWGPALGELFNPTRKWLKRRGLPDPWAPDLMARIERWGCKFLVRQAWGAAYPGIPPPARFKIFSPA